MTSSIGLDMALRKASIPWAAMKLTIRLWFRKLAESGNPNSSGSW